MPKYSYTALDAKGNKISGERFATSTEALEGEIQGTLLTVFEIKTTASAKPTGASQFTIPALFVSFFEQKVTQKELKIFCQQLYTLLKAGLPITMSVSKLVESAQNPKLRAALELVLVSLNQGRELAFGMSQSPAVFSDFMITLVKVGETSGQLSTVFQHLADYLDLEITTTGKIKSALRYPKMVIIAIAAAIMTVNIFVIPAFSKMFDSFHEALPLPTRILMGTSNFFVHYWYIMLIVFMGFYFGFRYALKTPRGALYWSAVKLKMPVTGSIVGRLTLVRFTKLFSILLKAGMTPYESIQLVGVSTKDAYFSQQILSISESIARGNSIASALEHTNIFPTLMMQMVSLGEASGSIETLLGEVSDFYQADVENDLTHLSEAIEPILLVVVGGMVLILALGVFLPLWNLSSAIGKT